MADKDIFKINLLEEEDIIFKIKMETVLDYVKCSSLIDEFIKKKKPLPKILFDKYKSYFIPVKQQAEEALEIKHNPIYKGILDRTTEYLVNEKYYFSYHNKKQNADFSLRIMLSEILSDLYLKSVFESIDKNEFIRKAFNLIEQYRQRLNKKHIEFLSEYKMKVIAGCIAIHFGYGLTNVTPLTNDAIFQGTRNAFTTKKKKKNAR